MSEDGFWVGKLESEGGIFEDFDNFHKLNFLGPPAQAIARGICGVRAWLGALGCCHYALGRVVCRFPRTCSLALGARTFLTWAMSEVLALEKICCRP